MREEQRSDGPMAIGSSPLASHRTMLRDKLLPGVVIAVILLFYLVNWFVERPQTALYSIDPGTSGFMADMRDYYHFSTAGLESIRYGNFPPFYQMGSAAIIHLIGSNWQVMNLVHNGFYFILLLIGVYLLGKSIDGKETGTLAAMLASLFPITYGTFDKFSMDFPLMALLAAFTYALLKSNMLADLKWSLAATAVVVWALLTKEPYAAFIAGPLAYALVLAVKAGYDRDFRPLRNFIIFSVLVIVLTAPYYLWCYEKTHWRIFGRLVQETRSDPMFANARFFTSGLWEEIFSPPFLLVVVLGSIPFFGKAPRSARIVFFLALAVPCLIFALMPHWKTGRYLMPAVPLFAVLGAFGLRRIQPVSLRFGIITLCIGAGIGQYYALKYDLWRISQWQRGEIYYFRPTPEAVQKLSFLKSTSGQLEKLGETLAQRLPQKLNQREFRMLIVPYQGDGMGLVQPLLPDYLWFRYRIPVRVKRAFETVDDILAGNTIEDQVPVILFTTPNGHTVTELPFTMLQNIWQGIQGPASPNDKRDWRATGCDWKKMMGKYVFCGKIAMIESEDVWLYIRRDVLADAHPHFSGTSGIPGVHD